MDIKQTIKKMTLLQKASLMSGQTQFDSRAIASLDIPSISYADGPHGVRKQLGSADHLGLNESAKATCFPTSATTANSWDVALGERVGRALGEESLYHNVDALLGPGLNIKRNPKCGRNFEYFSEDPYLSGKMAAAYIRGIQANGTIATPKHLAVNSQEYKRMTSDSIVDMRTYREIYTTAFEIAVKEGGAKSIMTSYNLINGIYANESEQLLRSILVDEWGFEGFVVSDWGGSNDHVLGVKNGSHAEMPGTGINGPIELVEAVQAGHLSEEILDQRVEEFLRIVMTSNANKPQNVIDENEHHEIAREAALKSAVLLKNEHNILPLSANTKVAIVGDFAYTPRYQGAGSSVINPTQLESIQSVYKNYPINVVGMAQGFERCKPLDVKTLPTTNAAIKDADVVILFLGLDEISESEGMDRASIQLPQAQRELLKYVKDQKKQTIVVLSSGSVVDMSWDVNADAILHSYLSGQAGAGATLELLTGAVSPSGKLAESYPVSYDDVPFGEDFPAMGTYAYHREGIFVGYRYYETQNVAVKYPFGFGLSYTQFEYSNIKVESNGVSVDVRNTGSVLGSEIVQMYVGKKDSLIPRPAKELKAFAKITLEPSETQTVLLNFDDKSFRHYSGINMRWEVEGGVYQIMVGRDVQSVEGCVDVTVEPTNFNADTLDPFYPEYFLGNVRASSMKDFGRLLGYDAPRESGKRNVIEKNSTIMDLKDAKNPLARFVSYCFRKLIARSERKEKPDLNLLFMFNMPFRAIGKMTNGLVDNAMIDGLLTICNGHFFKGSSQFIKAWNANRKRRKDPQWEIQ